VSNGTQQRRLILYMSMSLDGFLARTDHVIDWLGTSRDQDGHRQRGVAELLGQAGLLVLGATAYRDFSEAWPSSTSPTGDLINSLPKVVFSSSLDSVEWNARLSDRPVQEEIPELKREQGKDLVVFGGARFAHSLAEHRLIDEYRINVHPVALGEGLPLFHGLSEPLRLSLASTTAYPDGVVTHTYV
jgi:dihydrofolate reductase